MIMNICASREEAGGPAIDEFMRDRRALRVIDNSKSSEADTRQIIREEALSSHGFLVCMALSQNVSGREAPTSSQY
ncbi:MAG TPA: hypothetical protein DCS90_01235, partial [Ktedonobacter sp.]|jgi:hypothetical protein|nr:hypothetical protein [Ktedonobacter sp.]